MSHVAPFQGILVVRNIGSPSIQRANVLRHILQYIDDDGSRTFIILSIIATYLSSLYSVKICLQSDIGTLDRRYKAKLTANNLTEQCNFIDEALGYNVELIIYIIWGMLYYFHASFRLAWVCIIELSNTLS
jgi:hypothetical protein